MTIVFDYTQAFQRNLGVLKESEQSRLRPTTVALAALGGAGGAQLQALLRLGMQSFRLADPDGFELANFNRQCGASVDTVGHKKVEAVDALARRVRGKLAAFSVRCAAARKGADRDLSLISLSHCKGAVQYDFRRIFFVSLELIPSHPRNCRRR